ncbi:MAG: COG4280 domain-containing protein [Candidatus Dormibacteria bacterium]
MSPAIWAFGAAFLGSSVESVEALTVLLAVGLTRGWRSALQGAAVALVTLVAMVAAFGGVVARVPEATLKLAIGTLVLLFGLRWLHKAVLRAAGVISKHDEQAAFEETQRRLLGSAGRRVDRTAFVLAFQAVFLEGLEVAFIVVAAGAGGRALTAAAAGGIGAVLVVGILGASLRHPLVRIPENTLKYTVGIVLAGLGTFWVVEGMGVRWPFDAVSALPLAALYWVASRIALSLLRASRPRALGEAA